MSAGSQLDTVGTLIVTAGSSEPEDQKCKVILRLVLIVQDLEDLE